MVGDAPHDDVCASPIGTGLLPAYVAADLIVSPTTVIPALRSTVVRASARGAVGRGSIPDRVTPKT